MTAKILRTLDFLILTFFLCATLSTMSACDNDSNRSFYRESGESGTAKFSIRWHDSYYSESSEITNRFTAYLSRFTASLNCVDSNVSSVTANVYDENDALIESGGPWACEAHGGTVNGIKPGNNRKHCQDL